ncbi:MAG TPA: pyridoxamine 5'-phosphate oxidase family protein [Solirubrobacteraceae bacterium]|nr:pyridoxamine 5'-phosphate oxidase family protein [Solirubrobacteraceae bacterium]
MSWSDLEAAAPDFAAGVRARLDAHVHKTIATIRRNGSPRISGIETFWAEDELWFGSMPNAVKARDLQRDPRYALHSGSDDPPAWHGDCKLSGTAVELIDPERRLELFRTRGADPPSPDSHLFRLVIAEAALVTLNDARDRLVVQSWQSGVPGVRRLERE